jgi:CubicO group peptidase (beta-lactamase class C family)
MSFSRISTPRACGWGIGVVRKDVTLHHLLTDTSGIPDLPDDLFRNPSPQLLCDTERKIGLAYGAADSAKDEYARRIAYVIDEEGKVAQAHPKVDAATYPSWQFHNL